MGEVEVEVLVLLEAYWVETQAESRVYHLGQEEGEEEVVGVGYFQVLPVLEG